MHSTDRTLPADSPTDRTLLRDLMVLTPAHTLSRELLCLVLSVVLAAVLVAVIQLPAEASAAVVGMTALVMLIRLGAGFATRDHLGRRAEGGR